MPPQVQVSFLLRNVNAQTAYSIPDDSVFIALFLCFFYRASSAATNSSSSKSSERPSRREDHRKPQTRNRRRFPPPFCPYNTLPPRVMSRNCVPKSEWTSYFCLPVNREPVIPPLSLQFGVICDFCVPNKNNIPFAVNLLRLMMSLGRPTITP